MFTNQTTLRRRHRPAHGLTSRPACQPVRSSPSSTRADFMARLPTLPLVTLIIKLKLITLVVSFINSCIFFFLFQQIRIVSMIKWYGKIRRILLPKQVIYIHVYDSVSTGGFCQTHCAVRCGEMVKTDQFDYKSAEQGNECRSNAIFACI